MAVVAVLASYVVCSISFPYLIARLKGVDLRTAGSRKLGGSNLAASVGPLHGLAGGLLDAAKGFGAVVIAAALGLPLEVRLACGLAAIAGQMWPVFHHFGGRQADRAAWGFPLPSDLGPVLIALIPLLRRAPAPDPVAARAADAAGR